MNRRHHRTAITAVLLIVSAISAAISAAFANATIGPPPVSDVRVEPQSPSSAAVSWKPAPSATHYRIGYVNVDTDLPAALRSPTGDWRHAITFVEIHAANVVTRDDRLEYTATHLEPGARYAFSVLSSSNAAWDQTSVSGIFIWPAPVWTTAILPTGAAPTLGTTPTPTPTPTPKPTPPPTHSPTPAATPSTTSSTTPAPSPTTTPPATSQPVEKHAYWNQPDATHQLKLYMLDLINQRRAAYGAPLVQLADNPAADLHAQDMLQNQCFVSHWGTDGLKPYMRYSLTRGYYQNSENVGATGTCYNLAQRFVNRWMVDPEQAAADMMEGFISSPGHHRNILDDDHTHVNIAFTIGPYAYHFVQHFEDRHHVFTQVPTIKDNHLRFSGHFDLPPDDERPLHLAAIITHHPPPHSLTPRQLAHSDSYSIGDTPVAFFNMVSTSDPNAQAPDRQATLQHYMYPDPYDADPEPPIQPDFGAYAYRAIRDPAEQQSEETQPTDIQVPHRTVASDQFTIRDFRVSLDLADILEAHGPGVYTMVLHGGPLGSHKYLSIYSIFHEIDPPDRYAEFLPEATPVGVTPTPIPTPGP